MTHFQRQFLDAPKNSTLETLSEYGDYIAGVQRDVLWWLGDLARYAEARFPETHHQVWPEWISPGLVDRCKAVAKAYPTTDDRNPNATWSIHMQNANKPDRLQRVQAHVEAGRTSDEARKADSEEQERTTRWLLAVDVNYFLHRWWYSGAGVEAARGVAGWIARTVERLTAKGLTDVACCFDSAANFRRELTKEWEDRYKDRVKKDAELDQQIQLVRELLETDNFLCASIDQMEADDLMASYAVQFQGKITLLTQDKDMRQCLSDKCNILLDVVWAEEETTGEMMPDYKWLSAKAHTEEKALRPDQWADYQCIAGDPVDGVKGAPGIGEKGAADLIREFGSLDEVLRAVTLEDERIPTKKREALKHLAANIDVCRQLVTMRTDLRVPTNTKV